MDRPNNLDDDEALERSLLRRFDHHEHYRTPIPGADEPLKQQAFQLLVGVVSGVVETAKDSAVHWDRTLMNVAATTAAGMGMAYVAWKRPEAAPYIKGTMGAAATLDVVPRIWETGAAAVDTWKHPDHIQQNTKRVADSLGTAVATYGAYTILGAGTFDIANRAFGVTGAGDRLSKAFSRMSIPRMESSPNLKRPFAIAEPENTLAGSIYNAQKESIARVFTPRGSATGVVVDSADNLIATSYHVVRGKRFFEARVNDKEVLPAQLVGRDVGADLAILRTVNPPSQPFRAATIGDASTVKHGDPLSIIGHPFGIDKRVLSTGPFDKHMASTSKSADLVMNVAAHTGNSGSPVFNEAAEVVGVVSRGTHIKKEEIATNSEHLSELLKAVKANLEPNKYVDMVSASRAHVGNETPDIAKITSSYSVRDRNALYRSEEWNAKYPPYRLGSELFGVLGPIRFGMGANLLPTLEGATPQVSLEDIQGLR